MTTLDDARRVDRVLVDDARDGRREAFAELYQRHHPAALRFARSLTGGDDARAQDVVAEAFVNVWRATSSGGGSTSAFRPYLLSAVRREFLADIRKNGRIDVVDVAEMDGAAHDDGHPAEAVDLVVSEAFRSLPDHWRTVLWHTEIEGDRPAEIARMLGMSPNAVAALASRAREGLRQEYLRRHVASTGSSCAPYAAKLARFVRGALSRRDQRKINAHLLLCAECRRAHEELTEVNGRMRTLLPLLVIAGPLWPSNGAPAIPPSVAALGSAGLGGAGAVGASAAAGAGVGATVATGGGVLTSMGTAAYAAVVGATVLGLGVAASGHTPDAVPAAPRHGEVPESSAEVPTMPDDELLVGESGADIMSESELVAETASARPADGIALAPQPDDGDLVIELAKPGEGVPGPDGNSDHGAAHVVSDPAAPADSPSSPEAEPGSSAAPDDSSVGARGGSPDPAGQDTTAPDAKPSGGSPGKNGRDDNPSPGYGGTGERPPHAADPTDDGVPGHGLDDGAAPGSGVEVGPPVWAGQSKEAAQPKGPGQSKEAAQPKGPGQLKEAAQPKGAQPESAGPPEHAGRPARDSQRTSEPRTGRTRQ